MTVRDCTNCGGPLAANNRTGFCTMNTKCKRENKKVHDQDYDLHRRANHPKAKMRRYPPHPRELFEDGIIDHIAIEVAVSGSRPVRLTPTERRMSIERMVRNGEGFRTICNHLGIGGVLLRKLLDEAGYEILLDPVQPWTGAGKFLITRKDRKKKADATRS